MDVPNLYSSILYYLVIQQKSIIMKTYNISNGYKLIISIDNDSSNHNPRTCDNLSTCIFVGGKKSLGDKHNINPMDYNEWNEMHKAIIREYKPAFVKGVYLYSHSGETIKLSPFVCQFDSGQIGFIIVSKEAIRKYYGIQRVTNVYLDKAEKLLLSEFKELKQYVEGEIYHFQLNDENGNEIDSCGGFFGNDITENGILDFIDVDYHNEILRQV